MLNSRVKFVDLWDVNGIQYQTRINNFNIYGYIKSSKAPLKYFQLETTTPFFGIIEKQKLYIINTLNTGFTKQFMNKFKFLDNEMLDVLTKPLKTKSSIELQKLKAKTMTTLHKIANFKLVYTFSKVPIVDLTAAKHIVQQLNEYLNCEEYTISIDYVFDMKENTKVCSYAGPSATSVLLCIFTNDGNCVSSLDIGFFLENGILDISSGTKEEFKRHKMNTLLRAILILIAKYIHPKITQVVSYSINPISAHLMINTFNAIPYDERYDDVIPFEEVNSFSNIQKYMADGKGITCRIALTDKNIHIAEQIFNEIADPFCTKKII